MKIWQSNLHGNLNKEADDFNTSIGIDKVFWREDILGSIAHVTMLGTVGILPKQEAEALVNELEKMIDEIQTGKLKIDESFEDIHSFVEAELTNRVGDLGKKIHTARSRNDQVATDFKLYVKGQIDQTANLLGQTISQLYLLAEKHTETIMPGYTHLQRAQPISFAHHLLAYTEMFLRDIGRLSDCKKRMNECPLGGGALAGTTYPINRKLTAELLGFDKPTANSLDGVSDRDFCVELSSALSIIMVHLSRFCEELILWASHEFKFIEFSDAFSTGSSMMPQKKNPDIAELIRGKSGRVFGSLTALLTMLKGLPLAYNKDLQEDKELLFDAIKTVNNCLTVFSPMLASITVVEKNMRKASAEGFINATDCADYLVKKGLPFRDAYQVTGDVISFCLGSGQTLETLPLSEYQKFSPLFDKDVYSAVDLQNCLSQRSVYGSPSPKCVNEQIASVKEKVTKLMKNF